VTPSKSRKSDDRGESAEGRGCPSCGAAIASNARFCHACGASLQGGTGGGKWSARRLVGFGAITGVIAVAVVAVVMYSKPKRDIAPPSSSAWPGPMPMTSPGGPPDLSRMTPREAADRLFNRIMMASERNDLAEALRFVPMATEAYGRLPSLDRDAHYHLGLIYGVAGDRANVDRQIAALRQGAPNHLLALTLEHDAAQHSGDRAAASRILAAFASAYDAEIRTQRPEYEAHRNTIEKFRDAAALLAAPKPTQAGGAQQGAALFAAKCAACHGTGGDGSDKGPPLIHKIYEPGHHDNGSFHRAVRQGVRAHHWPFGDMAPVPGVSDGEVEQIIAYVRERQRAAGIR
jgi:mono/diheme cytochrome c family protein